LVYSREIVITPKPIHSIKPSRDRALSPYTYQQVTRTMNDNVRASIANRVPKYGNHTWWYKSSRSSSPDKEIKRLYCTMTAKSVIIFLYFCVFRIINVLFIQSQFDPDEYWQQLEPAYCRVFMGAGKPCPGLTWEWKRRPPSTEINSLSDFAEVGMKGPLRSYVSILPTLLFYYAIKFFDLDSPWAVARGPVFLNAILVAAPTDWSVWYLSGWMMSQSKDKDSATSASRWCTYCVLSSWFCAYALVRTYSNSLETLLLMISLCLVAPVRTPWR
jgi:hypothetical protein